MWQEAITKLIITWPVETFKVKQIRECSWLIGFAASAYLWELSKCFAISLFKKDFNCVFWHPSFCILVKRAVIIFGNCSLEEVALAKNKMLGPTFALKFWYDILKKEKENAALLSNSWLSNFLCFTLVSGIKNKASRFDVFSLSNAVSGE